MSSSNSLRSLYCGKYAYGVKSNVVLDKIQWPKLYPSSRPSDVPTAPFSTPAFTSFESSNHAIAMCVTHKYSVIRCDEHMGLLFFDKKLSSDADSDYRSRVICVVLDALQD